MKKIAILTIISIFLLTGLSFGQDCGKCPAKTTCAKAKKVNLTVYADKETKTYHKKECQISKNTVPIKLVQAKKEGFLPCKTCFPPKKKEKPKKPDSENKK